MDGKRLDDISRRMGLKQPAGRVHDFVFAFSFVAGLEPSLATLERIKVEQEQAREAGLIWSGYELPDEDLDMVVRKVYLARHNSNIQLAGGLIPQAEMKYEEVDRRPYVELVGRAREAFQRRESQDAARGE